MSEELKEIREIFKDRVAYIKVDQEFLDIVGNILEDFGKKNNVHIGDMVAIDYKGFRKCSQEEIDKIPQDDIVDHDIGTED